MRGSEARSSCGCAGTLCRAAVLLRLHLQAPPGAGKTTCVPLAMLQSCPEYLEGGKKIMVSEFPDPSHPRTPHQQQRRPPDCPGQS